METLGNTALSPDGKWIAYDFKRGAGGGDGELRYRMVGAADGAEKAVRVATDPRFSATSRFLLYTIGVDSAALPGRSRGASGGGNGRGGNAGANGAARNKVGIVDLRTGSASVLQDVQSFTLNKSGTHVALRRYPAQGRTGRGADLIVRALEHGTDVTFGNVADFAWSDDGDLLAMTTDVDGKTGNGVQVLNVATGVLRALDGGDALYAQPVWRAKSSDLAVMRSRVDSAFIDTSYAVLAWRDLAAATPAKLTYDFAEDSSFPARMRVASYRAPMWSQDGSILFFGIAPREPKPSNAPRIDSRPARVEVWHWGDIRQYHQQDRQAQQDRQKTHLVALRRDARSIVRLADDAMENVQLSENRLVAIATDEMPYFRDQLTGRPYRDVYRVDLATGKREKVVTKAPFGATVSPGGRYLLYAQSGHWWTYDLSSGKRTNITAQVKSTFVDAEDDHPVAERRGYGVGGWTTGDASVLLYDRFDVWQIEPDGSAATRLTRGAEDSTVYRVVSLDDEPRTGQGGGGFGFGGGASQTPIDPKKPITLSATGEFNKKSGFAALTLGKAAQRLLWLDKGVSRLEKAKNADVYSYIVQTASESPNVFTATGALTDAKQVSHTNAFLADFAWGKQVLMDYTTKSGEKLQMMLTYPADYQPGKKYPMVVYYYEKLSQGFHQFVVPSDRATYNTSVFSQEGYFVLRPDIRFRPRDPGMSGLECVTAAVQAALATGMIDPKKVGNMGHSWGGYQSAFYAVHGNGMFAATIAGAPLTNLVSFYGYTSFNTGLPETGHFETGQERMEVPLWEDPQSYIRNSTVFAMDKLQTPLLLEEGDVDGNVDYRQSMELYNAGRRLGKQVAFLLYNDENHGVARPESQMDYHRRQLEWFAHYLKGAPAPEWIAKGETYLARQKMLRDAAGSSNDVLPVQAGGVRP